MRKLSFLRENKFGENLKKFWNFKKYKENLKFWVLNRVSRKKNEVNRTINEEVQLRANEKVPEMVKSGCKKQKCFKILRKLSILREKN